MRFTPKSADEINAEGLLKDGIYPFRVLTCEEKTDKNGDGFFIAKLGVFDGSENGRFVYDNLSPVWMAHKLLHFCELLNLADKYKAGDIHPGDLEGREGYAQIVTGKANGAFPAKNEVKDYVAKPEAPAQPPQRPPARQGLPGNGPAAALDAESSDDIPF